MARNVRAGLLSAPKDLSPWPKYFYDEEGSQLFERITALPEYYQYRAELSILKEKASQIVALTRCRELVELGSGSANKTRALLDAIIEAAQQGTSGGTGGTNPVVRYIPVDVSESALKSSAKRLLEE
jgi:L-histidine Nalpha-methyltransferase